MDYFGDMGVNMGVTVRIISKDKEEAEKRAVSEEIKPPVTEKNAEEAITAPEKEKEALPHYERGYRAKTAYTRFGVGAVAVAGAVISAAILLSLWGIKSFGGEEAAIIADRIICEIG